MTDRLGSVRANAANKTFNYYPYGEEYTIPPAENQVKYGTYYRDQETGLDYADQRFYRSISATFLMADPYIANASGANNPADPGSWDRYAYVGNDPVNFNDSAGLDGNGVATGCFVTIDGVCDPSAPVDPCGVQAPYDGGSGFLPGQVGPCVSHGGVHSANGNPPPVPPTCTLEFEYRGLGVPLVGSLLGYHGYLDLTASNVPGANFVIEGYETLPNDHLQGGDKLKAQIAIAGAGALPADNPATDYIAGYISGTSVCSTLAFLRPAVASINAANISYGLLGPNSGSALRYLIGRLPFGNSWYSVPFGLWGWAAPLPGIETP